MEIIDLVPLPNMKMKLKVEKANKEDVYRDLVRIPAKHRVDTLGKPIPEGQVCEFIVTETGKRKLLSVRGEEQEDAVILADEITRRDLGLDLGATVEIEVRCGSFCDEFRWAWRATDPTIRASARSNLISVALGVVGLLLGLVGIVIASRSN